KKMIKFKEFNIQLFDVHIYIKRLSSFKTNKNSIKKLTSFR
ncbi:hypothetical protein HMPREF9497_02757, partial [Enterococcus faecalis TX4244]